jgi:CO/xanthine dehydrogenase FAD-binding subunit
MTNGVFEYQRPASLEEALAAMQEQQAMALAGGTDFVSMRNAGAIDPTVTVDIKGVAELRGINERAEQTTIGACTIMSELATLSRPAFGALRDGAGVVGAVQTRYRATLGGNVCRSSPAGDTLAPLLVLNSGATLEAMGAKRQVPLPEFFTGPGLSARRPDELLTSLSLPHLEGASAYQRHTYRAWMDLAVVGVAVWVRTEGGRCLAASVAICGAAPTPRLVPEAADALVGLSVEDERFDEAQAAVLRAADPIDDVRGSRAHRLDALSVLVKRVAQTAFSRAQGR